MLFFLLLIATVVPAAASQTGAASPPDCALSDSLILAGISAGSGLFGVFVGGWLTGRHQRAERHHAAVREQLERFYSPMVALRARIRARSETRVKVHGAADEVWRTEVERRMGPEQQADFEETMGPEFDKLVEEDNRRLREELLPLYHEMLDCFTKNMWLAEPDTRRHFPTLVEFVDIWDRALAGTIPRGVARVASHDLDPPSSHDHDPGVPKPARS